VVIEWQDLPLLLHAFPPTGLCNKISPRRAWHLTVWTGPPAVRITRPILCTTAYMRNGRRSLFWLRLQFQIVRRCVWRQNSLTRTTASFTCSGFWPAGRFWLSPDEVVNILLKHTPVRAARSFGRREHTGRLPGSYRTCPQPCPVAGRSWVSNSAGVYLQTRSHTPAFTRRIWASPSPPAVPVQYWNSRVSQWWRWAILSST